MLDSLVLQMDLLLHHSLFCLSTGQHRMSRVVLGSVSVLQGLHDQEDLDTTSPKISLNIFCIFTLIALQFLKY